MDDIGNKGDKYYQTPQKYSQTPQKEKTLQILTTLATIKALNCKEDDEVEILSRPTRLVTRVTETFFHVKKVAEILLHLTNHKWHSQQECQKTL